MIRLGLRVDLEVLEHTDRVWGSDVIDPLERQQIQRWTAQLIPPELVGSHVGAPQAHTTGRSHDLAFRAGTALFGSFGIEWNLAAVPELERKELASWVALIPAVWASAVLILRTSWEDALLHTELDGYADYARRTRFRLVPGIW